MKKVILIIVAIFCINNVYAQNVGVAFNNLTTNNGGCPLVVTLKAHDVINQTCYYYTSVPINAPVALTTELWTGTLLSTASNWTPAVVPDFTTINIDEMCVDFASGGCSGTPTCVGSMCSTPATATMITTCSCNNNKPILLSFSKVNFGGSWYFTVKMTD